MKIHPKIKTTGTLAVLSSLICGLGGASAADVLLLQELFDNESTQFVATPENNPDPNTLPGQYVVIGHGDGALTGADNRFIVNRRQLGSTGALGQGGSLVGDWMFAFRRMTTVPGPRADQFAGENMTNRGGRIKFGGIQTQGYGNIRIEMAISVGASGHEPNDDLYLRARFDGGEWIEVGGFKTSSSNAYPIYYQGPQDTMTLMEDQNKMTRFFADWDWPIPATGGVLEFQVSVEGNALNEDFYVSNVRVWGDPTARTFDASFASGDLTEPATGAIDNAITITLDEPAPDGGVTFTLTPSDSRSAVSVNLPVDTVTIPAGSTSATVASQIVQDGQYSGRKTVDVFVEADGFSTEIARVRVNNVTPKPNVMITEILNVVPGLQPEDLFGDANNDGVYHNTRDQFIEIVNFEDYPVDISGWRIGDDLADRHFFVDGTILQPNQAVVVFGGGIPRGTFGGAIVQVATGGGNGLGFNIVAGAEFAYLNATFNAEVDLVNIPLMRPDHLVVTNELADTHKGYAVSASVHRLSKDPTAIGFSFDATTIHSIIDGAEQRLFSPGTWYDGTPYFTPENDITLTVEPTTFSEGAGNNAATGTITLASPAPDGGMLVMLESDGFSVNQNGTIVADEITLDAASILVPAGATTATFRIGAFDDGVLDGDQTISLNARAGTYVLPGWVELTVTDVEVSDYDVVINEINVDVVGPAEDWNGDGLAGDLLGDQFIEVVNNSGRPVNLSGWLLTWDTGGTFAVPRFSHTFPQGTWLPHQGAIVVMGTITDERVNDPRYGGAIVQTARMPDGTPKRDGVDLERGSAFDIKLLNQHGFLIHMIEDITSASVSQGTSLTRVPDITGDLAPHFDSMLNLYAGFEVASPGLQLSGAPFPGNGQVLTPHIFNRAREVVTGTWLSDPVFGYLAMPVRYGADIPWVYSHHQSSFWFVHQAEGGIALFDVALDRWLWTNYSIYPWVYDYSAGSWQDINSL